MVIPTFVYVWGLMLLTIRGLRKWVEIVMSASASPAEEELMPESVKHMFS